MNRVRVLLAEDSRPIARQLRAILAQEFDVIGTVEDGVSLLRAALDMRPDVLVTDIAMPGLDGLSAVESLKRAQPTLAIVFITVHADRQMVDRAMSLGKCGYVLKSVAGEDLLPAVNSVVAGRSFISKSLHYQADAR